MLFIGGIAPGAKAGKRWAGGSYKLRASFLLQVRAVGTSQIDDTATVDDAMMAVAAMPILYPSSAGAGGEPKQVWPPAFGRSIRSYCGQKPALPRPCNAGAGATSHFESV